MLNFVRTHIKQQFDKRFSPQLNGRFQLPSLQQPVEIIRDRWGVPHIYAQNETDLFFAQGFVHAQDRLFQMDLNRRLGAGRLSELISIKGLATDRFARTMGWTTAAQNHVLGGDDEARVIANAYRAGINAFIAQGKLPPEFSLLLYKPEPWQLQDSAAWGLVLAWGLSANWQSELIRDLLIDTVGPEKTADLLPQPNEGYPTIIPQNEETARIGAKLAAQMLLAFDEAATALPLTQMPAGQNIGSNNWVVSGERMDTKRPFLANDPHLPPIFPSIWYENHLVGGRYNVTGFSTPGVPGILIGHNENVAWGITNGFPDIQDIFVERINPNNKYEVEVDGVWQKTKRITEMIRVRGHQPVELDMRYTHHGPIISGLLPDETRTLSLSWTSHKPNNHLSSILKVNRASDWASFDEGLRDWAFPPHNTVYADTSGTIGYIMPGQVPMRKKGSGMTPTPGWQSDYDWQGLLPHEELPRYTNPKSGVIATANNRVVPATYPHHLTNEWLAPYRAARILEQLKQKPHLTQQDHINLQHDTVSLMARRFLPLVLPYLADEPLTSDLQYGYELLQAWDGNMAATLVAPTLYFGWLVHLTQAVMAQALGMEVAEQLLSQAAVRPSPGNPFQATAYELLLKWLETGPPRWVGDVTYHIHISYVKSFVILRQTRGVNINNWAWGKIHQLKIAHPLSMIPRLGKLWKPITLAVSGSAFTVNQTAVPPQFPPPPVEMFASCRMLLDVGAWDNCLAVMPGGQSAYVNSPHYQDGIEDWVNGRYHPMLFSRERINAAKKYKLELIPSEPTQNKNTTTEAKDEFIH
ncbi:MAG: penicillin acylase family protein [Chloroflexota bacterium]